MTKVSIAIRIIHQIVKSAFYFSEHGSIHFSTQLQTFDEKNSISRFSCVVVEQNKLRTENNNMYSQKARIQ